MYEIVLIRHGESAWNKENRFTGWTDVPLSEKGIEEARAAGRLLKKEGYATGACGKWHLGLKPECRPNANGFDEFSGFLAG